MLDPSVGLSVGLKNLRKLLGSTLHYLHNILSISAQHSTEIVQAISRARFAQNLDGLRALATLIAVRDVTFKQLAIEGGIVRLIKRLV